MIAPRITTNLLVGALRRRAEAEGGFAMVLAKGDESAGAVMILLKDFQGERQIIERILDLDGKYAWRSVGNQAAANEESTQRFLDQRRRFDPDLWILELNIASIERFVAGLAEFD